MIIGSGMIAGAFSDVIIFASGVSDSTSTDQREFEREEELLTEAVKPKGKKIIYFSSQRCASPDTPYYRHKLRMERLIMSSMNDYLIFRVHNIIGLGGNPNNLVNYLFGKIMNNRHFDLWDTTRYFLSVDDLARVVYYCMSTGSQARTINVPGAGINIIDLVKLIEHVTNNEAWYNLVKKEPVINNCNLFLEKIGIKFYKDYVKELIWKKYIS